jgi:Icc-related predicted phosphoesterase
MKIYAISDIHADNRKYRTVFDLPRLIQAKIDKDSEKSILIICGDVAQNILVFHRYLKMFKRIPIPKLFVAGNHDLWVENGNDSLMKYLVLIKEACSDAGFHYLDQEPFIDEKIGFVGNIGWYDYSFKSHHTIIPEGMQLIKCNTSHYIQWEDLQDEDYELKTLLGEVDNNLFKITTWNDKYYIHWSFSDKEFTQRCLYQIQKQLAQVRKKINHLVFCSHLIHFQEGILQKNKVQWDFNNAFMGSREIGKTILNEEKLRLYLFGHSHESGKFILKNNIPAFNVSYQPNNNFTCIQINNIDGSVSLIS